MVAGKIVVSHGRNFLHFVAMLLWCSVATAGPAFVTGASIDRDEANESAGLTILLACQVNYLSHTPGNSATLFRIEIDVTSSCKGVSPTIANTQEYYLPARASEARLTSIDYDGMSYGSQFLSLSFSEPVSLSINGKTMDDRLQFTVDFEKRTKRQASTQRKSSHRVVQVEPSGPVYVINLESSIRPLATADAPDLVLAPGHKIYSTKVEVDGRIWYRSRLGFFATKEAAAAQLPSAWIDKAGKDAPLPAGSQLMTSQQTRLPSAKASAELSAATSRPNTRPAVSEEKLNSLMSDGREAMTDGRLSAAVQIYSKVLQYPDHDYMPEAQEYLGLARERNGQTAHAKAEYQRYLALYPEADGAVRVDQRLMALLANARSSNTVSTGGIDVRRLPTRAARQTSAWRFQTFLSQYYRLDANQIADNDDVISQSSLYSDINFDARRRGTRFDFGSRLSAGFRYDMLDEDEGPGNDLRVTYAFADLADTKTGLRGRIGRQSRNTGGVLGRFDGLNLAYQATERTLLNAVAGKPVNSTADGIDDSRTFYGLSANFGPIADNLDIGGFYIQQNVDGFVDRESVGAELRYFDANKSLWGLADYDLSFQKLGAVFLQGTYRFESQLTINALLDSRHSPFLRTSNAMIGQSFADIAEMIAVFGEQEVRQLSLDRSAITTTYTIGASYPLSPKFQINGNVTQSTVLETAESGGVAATPESVYRYYSMNLVASSLLREGDVSIFALRYSQSVSADVTSVNMDIRYPFSRSFYINPRLRADYRQIHGDGSTEWILTPGLRIQFRIGRVARIELQAGKRYSLRDVDGVDLDRESYFINLGYQAFF